ncbi:MAG: hypothetical protein J6330_01295 [Clostridia bacterium]|nr:hypothetical protein [Clostridia bacterium]
MKIKRIVTTLLAAVMVMISITSCVGNGSNYSDANAYVSVYVYGMNNKTLYSADGVRVAPQDPYEEEETTAGGLLTEEAARQRYRTKPTGMLALEVVVRNKDKNAELPTVVISQFNGEIEYTLDSVNGNTAGKLSTSNDIYEWVFTINGEVADPFTADLHNYDLLKFQLLEKTERNFFVKFAISNGADTILSETQYNVFGNKPELTIAKCLQTKYINEKDEEVKPLLDEFNMTLSEDGRRVVKIGNLENDEEHRWVCIMGEEYGDEEDEEAIEIIINDLSDTLISEKDVITFDYREFKSESTDTDEAMTAEEQPAE